MTDSVGVKRESSFSFLGLDRDFVKTMFKPVTLLTRESIRHFFE